MITGIIFDKDGTLFDFRATWAGWTRRMLLEATGGDRDRAQALGGAVGFDLSSENFAPDSPVIHDTPDIIADVLLPFLPGVDRQALVARMVASAADNAVVEAAPLVALMAELRAPGRRLGVATNDGEAAARAHLRAAGVETAFDYVAGFDSGHGGKPAPGMLLAFCKAFGLDPGTVLMVGDSVHDLVAGQRAGMRRAAVLTGIATEADLSPHAEVVLPDIGHLPGWLAATGG
ncbi:MAG: HAD family hydrolase [Paracoccaceae bacterium]